MKCRIMAACSILQHLRQQFAACARTNGYENGRYEPLQPSVRHQWQTQSQVQQPQLKSSAFQASFNGGSCAKREYVGIGVFLPQNYYNPLEPRKQTGLPTVRPVKFHGNGLSYKDTKERNRHRIPDIHGHESGSPDEWESSRRRRFPVTKLGPTAINQ